MNDFFKKFISQLKDTYNKLGKRQKIIIGAVVAVVFVSFILLISFSAKTTKTVLYTNLNAKDFGEISKKLQEWGYEFTPDNNNIWVKDDDKQYIKMKLAQEGLIPSGIKGWDLFDTQKWTTTDFERNINKRRAVIGEITRHIKLLDDVEDVSIQITMPEKELYIDEDTPWKASVIITPAPYSDIAKNKDKIKGIINIVAFGVDKLSTANIVVSDNHGNILSDFSDEEKTDYLKRAREENKISEKLKSQVQEDIYSGLSKFIGKDMVDVRVFLDVNFNQEEMEKKEFIPVQLKKDNPATPYDESEYTEKISRSEKDVNEKFQGYGFVPEGPPGVEPNYPPGYKEASDKYGKYEKNEKIRNYEISEQNSKIKKSPFKIDKVSVAAWVDGVWKKVYDKKGNLVLNKDLTIKREYIPRSEEELKKYEDIIKGSIGYNSDRGDLVVVKNVKFNWEDKWKVEDIAVLRRIQLRKTLVWTLVTLFSLFLATLVYKAVTKEIARRRRIREEELAMQQQLLREQALKSAEKEAIEVEMSLEEKARIEMQQNAINIAKEKPEDVASLLRTWLAEE
ncbi:MAG: flagellar basal-body MS-ring/collar protein FliF [bacterium]|nr:flagellar basal-body MS-ring/collar protein FliF [bacterium]